MDEPVMSLYEGLRIIRTAIQPFDVEFVKFSAQKNDGGERITKFECLPGPLRENMNANDMVGLKDSEGNCFHIYIHSLLKLKTGEQWYKLVLQ